MVFIGMFKKPVFPLCVYKFAVIGCVMLSACNSPQNTPLEKHATLWIADQPYSADPLDYDAFCHHIAFSSVNIGLVTNYSAGRYAGIIAKEWEASPDHKVWRFLIRKNMRFANGDPITPKDVVNSWRRLALILKRRGSQSGVFEKIEGFNSLEKTGRISGISSDENHVTLRFREPMPKLLDMISFGLYAVVHHSCYDANNETWLNPRQTIASGAYIIKKWDEESLVLQLREDFPAELRHSKPLSQVEIVWAPDKRLSSDIISGNSREKMPAGKYAYYGEAESRIAYIRCQSWTHPASPVHDKKERKQLRSLFYSELEKSGFKPTRSFFPLAIKSVHEIDEAPQSESKHLRSVKSTINYRPYRIEVSPLSELATKAMKQAAAADGLEIKLGDTPKKTMSDEFAPDLPLYHNDLVSIVTGILIDSPESDIRFMFKSKEGIRLPDPTGKGLKLINKSPIDIQKVNEMIWDDAIIWPVTHLSIGLWGRAELDFSLINTILPPTAIHLIGRK